MWEKLFYVHSKNDAMQLLQTPAIQSWTINSPMEMSQCQYNDRKFKICIIVFSSSIFSAFALCDTWSMIEESKAKAPWELKW